MARGEARLSRPSTSSRHRQRPPGEDADEATSPKRQKRSPHRHHHRHRHGHGDRGDRDEASRTSSAKPGEGVAEDGEIQDDDAATARDDFGQAGLVFSGLAPAPEYDDKSDANVLHASRLANQPSKKYDVSANTRKLDHAAHETENGTICSSDRRYCEHSEPVERMPRFSQSRSDREMEHKNAEVNDTEARSRPGYLVSRKEIKEMQSVRDERHARSKVSQMEDHSMIYPYSRKHSEAHHMNCLRSTHAYRETSSEAHAWRNVVRDASEHENGGRSIELDKYSTRRLVTGRGSYKERESSMGRDIQSSSTHKDDDGRRKDKINDSCKVTDTVGNIRGMEKFSGDRDIRHFRANKMDAHQTGELNSEHKHNDSKQANYGLSSNSKDMPISGEKCREANHRRKRSEEINHESCKEEDQDNFEYLGQKEDDTEIIKEEARKRRDAILEKHRQRQLQKQQPGPVPCLDSKVKLFIALKHLKNCSILHCDIKPDNILGAFTSQHFDQDLNFHATDENLMMKKTVNKLHVNLKPKGVGSKISSFPGEDPKMLSRFKDLLEKIFVLDPEKRLTVSQALGHPFITCK